MAPHTEKSALSICTDCSSCYVKLDNRQVASMKNELCHTINDLTCCGLHIGLLVCAKAVI
jgi:hypothetical protein